MQRGFDPAVGHDHGAGGTRAGIDGVILRKTKQAVSKIIRPLDDVIAIVIGVRDRGIVDAIDGRELEERGTIDDVRAALVFTDGDGALDEAMVPGDAGKVAVANLSG